MIDGRQEQAPAVQLAKEGREGGGHKLVVYVTREAGCQRPAQAVPLAAGEGQP